MNTKFNHLKKLSTHDLDSRIKSLAQKERELLLEILLTLKEIDSRRSYLELGFGSLFDYLVKGIGYSEGSAQRRIDAARLLREVPEMAPKIQSGELKLNQVSLVQKTSRELFKQRALKVTPAEKKQILENLVNKTQSDSQKEVAAFFDVLPENKSHQKIQADGSVHFEFTLSKEIYAKVKKAQELLSHSLPDQDIRYFLEFLSDKVIQQKTGQSNATVAVKRKTISAFKTIKATQSCCQYKDPKSGQQCQSTWQLQVDHKHSTWAGGTNEISNFQMLCAAHNKFKYRKEAGIYYQS